MFGLLFKGISSIASFVFPILASYRALERDDITLIRPWLMYWVIIALQLTVETYFGFILNALPLYSLARTVFLLWLVLPQTQGASQLYLYKVRPFLHKHDQEIDNVIVTAHNRAKSMGAEYISSAITYIQNLVYSSLGLKQLDVSPSAQDVIPAPASNTPSNDVESLFSRFRLLPSTDGLSLGSLKLGFPAVASTGVGLLSSYLSSASSTSKGISIPSSLSNKDDRLKFLEERKKELSDLLANVNEQQRSVELENDDDSVAKDEDFDFVEKKEFKEKPEKTSSDPNSEHDTSKGASSAVETAETRTSWFRFR